MTNPPPLSLSGLWMFDGQQEVLDNELARLRGLDPSDHKHGTYTRFCYHRIVMDELPGEHGGAAVKNAVLNIFDENGYFGHFVWNGTDGWESRNEPVVFTAGDSPLGKKIARSPCTPPWR